MVGIFGAVGIPLSGGVGPLFDVLPTLPLLLLLLLLLPLPGRATPRSPLLLPSSGLTLELK